jgi:hypothetical protein
MGREPYNLYREVHKGIRAVALDLVEQSGRTDFAEQGEIAALRGATQKAFAIFESHAAHETEFITPVLRVCAPALAADSDADHRAQELRLRDLARALEMTAGAGESAPAMGHAFVVGLSRFVGEMLVHMADEEERIMPALRAAFDEDALRRLHEALLASIPPQDRAGVLSWMLPAMNAPERASLIAGLRAGLPIEAFEAVSGVARRALGPLDWDRLEATLALAG